MNAQDCAAILLYVITVSMLGFGLLRASGLGSARTWGMCYIAGQLVALLITLVAAMLGVPLSVCVFTAAIAGCGAWVCLQVSRAAEMNAILRSFLWSVALGLLFPMAWVIAFSEPLKEWDARSIWFFHARVLFFDNGLTGSYLAQQFTAWSHPDYPLFVPTQAVWTGLLRGEWDEPVVKIFLFLNFLAYMQIFFEQGRREEQPLWILLPLTVFLFDLNTAGYVDGMADNHYAICLVLALLAMVRAGKGYGGSAGEAVLLLGVAAATKNEGLVLAVVLALVLVVARRGRRSFCSVFPARSVCVPACFALAPIILWQVYKIVNGIGNDLDLTSQAALAGTTPAHAMARVAAISRYLWQNTGGWDWLVPTVILAGITLLRIIIGVRSDGGLRLKNMEWAAWFVLLFTVVLVFGVYVLTPRDVRWHMETSLSRVAFFPRLLVQAMLVLSLEAFLFRRTMEAPEQPDR